MKKSKLLVLLLFTLSFLVFNSCVNSEKDSEHVKKRELSKETIAVGIYKTCNPDPVNIKNIIEALRIDGGIVAVTLTDKDILKTELENIDVLLFPGLGKGESNDSVDERVREIIRRFVIVRGKGTIGICSGNNMLTTNSECKTLSLIGFESIKLVAGDDSKGLFKFKLTSDGEKIFPELRNIENSFIDYHGGFNFDTTGNANPDLKIIGQKAGSEPINHFFITSTIGKGRVFLSTGHPESTPGMRWMLPRMVRWVVGHEFGLYEANVLRPDYFKDEINYTDKYFTQFDSLIIQLNDKKTDNILDAINKLQENYPWLAAEKISGLLKGKDSEIRIRAAKYLSEVEYTAAIDDLEKVIHKERRKKIKDQLKNYLFALEMMIEQNSSME